jgi:hypothetical protein
MTRSGAPPGPGAAPPTPDMDCRGEGVGEGSGRGVALASALAGAARLVGASGCALEVRPLELGPRAAAAHLLPAANADQGGVADVWLSPAGRTVRGGRTVGTCASARGPGALGPAAASPNPSLTFPAAVGLDQHHGRAADLRQHPQRHGGAAQQRQRLRELRELRTDRRRGSPARRHGRHTVGQRATAPRGPEHGAGGERPRSIHLRRAQGGASHEDQGRLYGIPDVHAKRLEQRKLLVFDGHVVRHAITQVVLHECLLPDEGLLAVAHHLRCR